MLKSSMKQERAKQEAPIHIISSEEGMFPKSYSYREFPTQLAYFEWVRESLETHLGQTDCEEELNQQLELVRSEIDALTDPGFHGGKKAQLSGWGFSPSYYFGWDVECAGEWQDFVPKAIELVLEALREQLREVKRSSPDKVADIQRCICSMEAFACRKDVSSKAFSDDFATLLERCIEEHLQHY